MSAFRNYFNDVRDFISLMVAARKKLAPEAMGALAVAPQ
jgi:hypothetical protein